MASPEHSSQHYLAPSKRGFKVCSLPAKHRTLPFLHFYSFFILMLMLVCAALFPHISQHSKSYMPYDLMFYTAPYRIFVVKRFGK